MFYSMLKDEVNAEAEDKNLKSICIIFEMFFVFAFILKLVETEK